MNGKYLKSARRACAAAVVGIVSALLSLSSMAQTAWDGTVANAFAGGDGTESSPYLIATPAQLAHLAAMVNDEQGENWSRDKHFKLTADIVLNTEVLNEEGTALKDETVEKRAWTPIGSHSDSHSFAFQGVFDGQNYTVSGLFYDNNTTTGTYVGVFGAIHNATVKNLKVRDSYVNAYRYIGLVTGYVTSSSVSECYSYGLLNAANGTVGGVAGSCYGMVMDNCANYAIINCSTNSAGGVAGYAGSNSVVSNCVNNGSVTNANGYSGGIVANFDGTMTGCTNNAAITNAQTYTGGIVGNFKGTISDCTNRGKVSNTSTESGHYTGGVVAYSNAGSISDCHNHANVEGYYHVGGVLGGTVTNIALPVSGCSNYGQITGHRYYVGGVVGQYCGKNNISDCENNGDILVGTKNEAYSSRYIGGVLGTFEDNGSGNGTYNCVNKGTITAVQNYKSGDYAPDYVGGVVGYSNRNVVGCINDGNIVTRVDLIGSSYTATFEYYGGIVGYLSSGYTMRDNINNAKVMGSTDVAGILGHLDNGIVIDNTNNGEVVATANNTGGIMGYANDYNSSSRSSGNKNTGAISGQGNVGGIIGQFYCSNVSLNNLRVYDNRNEGVVVGSGNAVGGIIGYLYAYTSSSGTGNVYNNVNVANVYGGGTYVGGVIGYVYSRDYAGTVNIYDNYNTGNIAGTSTYVGGVAGRINMNTAKRVCNLRNNYNLGSVEGSDLVGGVIGNTNQYVNINNCYSAAESLAVGAGAEKLGLIIGQLGASSTLVNSYAKNITDVNLIGAETTPKEKSNNRTFGEDGVFDANTVTVGTTEGITNLLDALNAWSEQNSFSAWGARADRNEGWPYQQAFVVSTPQISQDASNNYTITTPTEGATIYYTVDRTEPTTASTVYDGAFTTSDQNYIKAFAVKYGYYDSEVGEFDCYTSAFTPGDVNNDKRVLTSDIVITVNYILGKNPVPFIFRAADVNKDNQVNVADVTGIVDIILGRANAPARIQNSTQNTQNSKLKTQNRNEVAFTYADGFGSVAINSAESIKAFQFDVLLPEGVVAAQPALTGRATESHTMGWSEMADGSLRFISYSMSGAPFSGNDGDVLSFTLDTNDVEPGLYPVAIQNITLVRADGTTIQPEAIAAQLVIGDANGIDEVENSTIDNRYSNNNYNLNGQRVGDGYKGIVIKNGKKTL